MRGHVRRRGKGWCYVIDVGRDPGIGRRRQKWVSGFGTRREAEEAMRATLRRMDTGHDPFPAEITLCEFVEERWLPHLETQDRPRAASRRRYGQLIGTHLLPHIGELRLDRVKPAHIQSAFDAMTQSGLAPRTVGQARAAVSSALQAALRWQLIEINPARATQAPTPQKPELVVPTASQLRGLIDAAEGTVWAVPVMLAATTGARRGEVLGLRWEHVDLDRGTVRIEEALQRLPGGELAFVPPKTERARRTIPLPGFAIERLKFHRADQARRRLEFGKEWGNLDLVCERGDGSPVDPSTFTHAFGRLARAVGLEGCRLHDVRHGVLTALAKSGTPAYVTSRIAGHSSVSFTESVYTHPDEEMVERAMRGLEEALGN